MLKLSIDAKHNQAIRREIGARLRGFLRVQPDVPAHLRELVRQFGEDGYRALPPEDLIVVPLHTLGRPSPGPHPLTRRTSRAGEVFLEWRFAAGN